jgi:hypothetical protein
MKQLCPRVVDFWITHVAGQLGRPEAYIRDLYHTKGSGAANGSRKDDEDNYVDISEDEASTMDDCQPEKVLFSNSKPKNSTSASTEVLVKHNDIDLKQEIECRA